MALTDFFKFPLKTIASMIGIKPIKYWVDNKFRKKVIPIEGSVLYSDLYAGAEHSGIYVENNKISNIVVDGFITGVVKISNPNSFTDGGLLHRKIYVSCDKKGAVGDNDVSKEAKNHVGEENFYGLIFNNCHEFSERCVNYSSQEHGFSLGFEIDETWERTIRKLKRKAKKKLGAKKWLLWDWKNDEQDEDKIGEKPNEEEMLEQFRNFLLNDENIRLIKNELSESKDYLEEISDENIPREAVEIIEKYSSEISNIDVKYEGAKGFIKIMRQGYSYNQLIKMSDSDYMSLVNEMENNEKIKEIINRMGRNYVSEEKKYKNKINKRMKKELFGGTVQKSL